MFERAATSVIESESESSSGSPGAELRAARLSQLSRRERWILLGLVLGGACLRIAYQWERPFTGDEIGTLQFLEEDYTVLLTQFRSWLTMNFYMAALKAGAALLGSSPWTLVAPSLVAGIAVVPVVAAITLRLSSARHALLAAALAAYNPFLVHYSVQIRSYMLLTLFALLAALAYLDWQREPGWRAGWKVALSSAAAFLLHPNGAYQVAALAVLCFLERRLDRPVSWSRAPGKELLTLVAPSALALALALLAYRPLFHDMEVFRKEWSYTSPTSVHYLPGLFEDYFAGRYGSLATLLLFVAGLWWASRIRPALLGLVVLIGVPMVLVSLMGVSHFPWAYSRFLLPILPLSIIVIALPLRHARSRLATLALVASPFIAWAPGLARLFAENRDYPWRAIADHLAAEVGERDRILAVDYMSQHQLAGQEWGHAAPGRSYAARFVDAAALVKLSRRRGQGSLERLLVLCTEPNLATSAENRSFGKVQIVTYRQENGTPIADALIADLAKTLRKRIEARLATHYKLLHELVEGLRNESEANEVLVRFLKSQNLFHRERQRPIQQR